MRSVTRDSWRLKPILKYLQNLQNISFPIYSWQISIRAYSFSLLALFAGTNTIPAFLYSTLRYGKLS
jgi:hypothetical protein